MTKEELINILESLRTNAEVLINTNDRYAEIKDVRIEYSQRVNIRKPYVIINIYSGEENKHDR